MEWFKFRMCWRRPLLMLSDEEAGKVIKALVSFMHTGEEQETGCPGDILLCQMTDVLQADVALFRQKEEKKEALRAKRSAAGKKSAEVKRARSTKENGFQQIKQDADTSQHMLNGVNTSQHMLNDVEVCSVLLDKNKNTEIRYTDKEKEKDIEAESEGDITFCSEPPSAVSELPVTEIPLNDNTQFPVYRRDADEYAALYPAVDIDQELRNIRGWCLANPSRRKTKRGVKAFINSWLSRSQDKAGKRDAVPENPFLAYALGEKEIGGSIL